MKVIRHAGVDSRMTILDAKACLIVQYNHPTTKGIKPSGSGDSVWIHECKYKVWWRMRPQIILSVYTKGTTTKKCQHLQLI